jgi:hypothetical protein
MTDHKKPGVAFWATVAVVVVLMLYVLSLGPACWITSRMNFGTSTIGVIYRPIVPVMWRTGDVTVLGTILDQYSRVGAAPHWQWERVDFFGPDPWGPAYLWVCFKK